ncbi:MAG: hypothetical protein U0271_39070 [Polyangiaceae bacterium]
MVRSVLVAVGVTTALACNDPSGAGPAPISSSSASATRLGSGSAGAPASARPDRSAREALAPGDDHAVPSSQTWQASKDARPSWSRTDRYAPAMMHDVDLFAEAKAEVRADKLRDALIVCRMTTTRNADVFTAGELFGTLSVGALPRHEYENAKGYLVVSFPLAALDRGASISIGVTDKDIIFDDSLGGVTLKYAGVLPLSGASNGVSLECRGLLRQAVEALAAEAMSSADKAVRQASADYEVDAAEFDWGFTNTGVLSAKTAVEDLAALLGWADPRVARRLAWLEAVFARVEREIASVAASIAAGAPSEAALPFAGRASTAPRVRMTGYECGAGAAEVVSARAHPFARKRLTGSTCLVRVELASGDARVEQPVGVLPVAFQLVLESGRVVDLDLVDIDSQTRDDFGRGTIEPQKTGTLLLAASQTVTRPVLFRARSAGQIVALAVSARGAASR